MKEIDWSGEGPPPAGTICEYQIKNGPWYECEIKYILDDGDDVVMFCPHLGIEQVAGVTIDRIHFRPIKTQEQIKAEELQIGVQKIMDDAGITDSAFKDDPEAWVWAAALYNKGYKLQEDK